MAYGEMIEVKSYSSAATLLADVRRRQRIRDAEFARIAHAKRQALWRETRRRRAIEKMQRNAPRVRRDRDLLRLKREEKEIQEQRAAIEAERQRRLDHYCAAQRERAALDDLLGISYSPSIHGIIYRICRATGVSPRDIMSARRSANVCFARQAIMYWAARLTSLSYPQIGRRLGDRDHTTALHGAKIYPKKRARQGRTLRPILTRSRA